MNERQEIMQAWNKYSATAFRSPQFMKAQAFFQMVNERPDICWEDLANEFRNNYYDAFDHIVPVLISTDDPLIVYHVMHFADLGNPKEADMAKNAIRTLDPQKHEVTMNRLAANPSLQPELLKKAQLPESVRTTLGLTSKVVTKPA